MTSDMTIAKLPSNHMSLEESLSSYLEKMISIGDNDTNTFTQMSPHKPQKSSFKSIPRIIIFFCSTFMCLSSSSLQCEAFSSPINQNLQRRGLISDIYLRTIVRESNIMCTHSSIRSYSLNILQRRHLRGSSTKLHITKKKPMPIVGYNGQDICDYYDRSPLTVGWRLNILSLPLLGKLSINVPFSFYLINL